MIREIPSLSFLLGFGIKFTTILSPIDADSRHETNDNHSLQVGYYAKYRQ
jgi:hypothetical protein